MAMWAYALTRDCPDLFSFIVAAALVFADSIRPMPVQEVLSDRATLPIGRAEPLRLGL